MTRAAWVQLNDREEGFLVEQVQSGRYASESDVIEAALNLLEERESRTKRLARLLQDGLDSGVAEDFDFGTWLDQRRLTGQHGEAR